MVVFENALLFSTSEQVQNTGPYFKVLNRSVSSLASHDKCLKNEKDIRHKYKTDIKDVKV